MKKKLNDEELEILNAYENNLLKSTKNEVQEIEQTRVIAKNTLAKSKHISIRLSERDLKKIKIKAIEVGMSYQTIISTLVHQYAEDKIKVQI